MQQYNIENMFSKPDEWTETVYYRTLERLRSDGADAKYSFAESFRNKEENMMTLKEAGEIYCQNIITYGSANWYYWCIDNWGTKWNSMEAWRTWEDDSLCYYFLTAWSVPGYIYERITNTYHEIAYVVEYAEEDVGNNCGRITCQDGRIEEWTPTDGTEAIKFSIEVLNYDEDDISDYLDEDEIEDVSED